MSRSVDAWDDEPRRSTTSNASGIGSTSNVRPKAAPVAVKDDWEDDDEEEEDSSLEDKNRQLWEDANNKEHHPMPAVVISRGVSASITTPTLPLNQPPPMRILKRPSASPSPSTTNVSTPTGETLQEREARYQAARERIFGGAQEAGGESTEGKKNPPSKKSGSQSTSPTPSNSSPNSSASTTKVVRNPRGPSNSSSVSVNGFGERKKVVPPNPTAAAVISSTTASTDAS
ncbi:hypothetical protein BDN70DRAFT_872993 [Pholiota conissans]|uniref:SUZ RNA-binding domain-containing n=1 Tax=Pholiota conissans TaxID=109636 RepID=A0A9P5ZBZ7_9AGAR|nr:hypothetical protein BDN70DRAFT_872993 [Pholiota conissans]